MPPAQRPLRVLVVDDSALYRKVVRDVLSSAADVEVVGAANNGRIALDQIATLRPDVVTLDLEMPELDGIGVLRELAKRPNRPAAIMVSAFTARGAEATTTALQEGAFDFILKPTTKSLSQSVEQLRRDLLPKLRACSVQQAGRRAATATPVASRAVKPPPQQAARPAGPVGPAAIKRPDVIGIAVSTGGPQALTQLLPALPADFACPIVMVQHMPPMFTGSLARDLDRRCRVSVAEAEEGRRLEKGLVLIAPGGKQMKVARDADGHAVVRITDDPPERNCKPAADYLFRSLAQEFRAKTLGVVLTGMGDDGSGGAADIKRVGGSIISQDEASCVVYGMPRAVADGGITDLVLPLRSIADRLTRVTTQGVLR
ncbi:MAG: chemotaxis response regulator protein-glutamate methylesterase [Planctomycetota bacterium]